MKRETRKQKDISAFKIDIDELDGLISSLKHEFNRPEDVSVSITLKFNDEELEFKSVDEIRSYKIAEKSCSKFKIHLFGDERSFSLSTEHPTFGPEVRARGDRKSWCAEIIETAESYLNKHRVWHSWISGGGMSIFILSLTILLLLYYNLFTDMPTIGFFGSFLIVILVIPIWSGIRDRFYPVGVLILNAKSLSEERMLKWTTIGAIAAILGLFHDAFYWLFKTLTQLLNF